MSIIERIHSTCCSVSSLGNGLSISSSEEGRGCPVPIWTRRINKTKNNPLKNFQTASTIFIQNKMTKLMTRSMVFFLLASERVWSTKVSQRPLQSSGSSTPTTKKTAALKRTKVRFSASHTRKCWNYITLLIMVDVFAH